ncbi:hypothetical protein LTS18_006716, partial [Coniosporium uncinatum]
MAPAPAPLPPNPSLVAILLIVKSRTTQSRLVFHYPARPTEAPSFHSKTHTSWYGSGAAGSSTATDSDSPQSGWSSTSEDDVYTGREDAAEEKNGSQGAREGSVKGKRTHGSGSVRSKLATRSDVVDEEVTVSSENSSDEESGGWLSRPGTGTRKNRDKEDKGGKD